MHDVIRLTGIEVVAAHGPLDEERATPRTFLVDLVVGERVDNAAIEDQMVESFWYEDLVDDVVTEMTGESVRFLETLGLRIAERILDRGALSVEVTMHKPDFQAAVPVHSTSITIRRINPLYDDELGIRRVVLRASSYADNAEEILDRLPQELSKLDLYVVDVGESQVSVRDRAGGKKNCVTRAVVVRTAMSPIQLRKALRAIEVRLGRDASSRALGHTIEVSIMTFGTLESALQNFTFPHPEAINDIDFLRSWLSVDPKAHVGGVKVEHMLRNAGDS